MWGAGLVGAAVHLCCCATEAQMRVVVLMNWLPAMGVGGTGAAGLTDCNDGFQ